ncbi:MAG: hypothetical protein ACXAC6_17225 [Candidatus Hodarchaeales archaeon]|jgi:hypothetical protein
MKRHALSKKFWNISLLIFILFLAFITKTQSIVVEYPLIDGIIEPNEWINGDKRTITMVDGTLMETTLLFNLTHLFLLLQITDNDPTLYEQSDSWDIFGVEFDNNHDQVPMGMSSSPDDALFVSYSKNGGQDFILQGMRYSAIEDTTVNGINDVIGKIGLLNKGIFAEVSKLLNSGDKNGADISLKSGDEFYAMFAFWDNKEPYQQSTSHSNWILYEVPGTQSDQASFVSKFLVELIIASSFVIIAVLVRFRPRTLKRN